MPVSALCMMCASRVSIPTTTQGFLQDEKPKALEQFNKASECFKKCQAKVGAEGELFQGGVASVMTAMR